MSDIEHYREWLRTYDDGKWVGHAERSDDELAAVIERAKNRIGGRRLSWNIVAAQIMDEEG